MANDSILIDTKQIDRLVLELRGFEPEVAEATMHALNRTLEHVVTQVGRIVPKLYAVKAKDVKETFKGGVRFAKRNDLAVNVLSRGHTLSMAHFPHSPKDRPASRKYKVRAIIKRDVGRKTITTDPLPFVASTGATTKDKVQTNVFRRTGPARLPIVVIRTLSIPQMITNENVSRQITDAAEKKLGERLEHEIIMRMTSVAKKVGG